MKIDLNILFSIGITAALAVIGTLIKVLFSLIIKRIESVEGKNSEIESNYIAKFNETNTNILAVGNQVTSRLDEKIDHLTEKIENKYVTKDFCSAIHRGEQ